MTPKQKAASIVDHYIYNNGSTTNGLESSIEQALIDARVEELESVVNQPVGCARTFYIKDRLAALKAGKGGG